MSLARLVFKNTVIHFMGKAISLFLMLVSFALVARHLGQFGFGQFTTVISYIQVFAIFSDMGLYLVFITMLSQEVKDERQLLGNFFSFRIMASIVVLVIGLVIAYFIPQYSYIIKIGISITALSFLFGSLVQLFTGFFQKKLKMNYVVYAEIIGRVCLLLLIAIIIWLNLGLLSILSAMVISGFIIFALLFIFVYKFETISLQFDFVLWRNILKKAWPVGLSIILTTIYFKGDTIILSLYQPFEQVGIYGAAYRILEALIMFPPIFMGLVLAPLAHAWVKKDKKTFKQIYQRSFDFFVILIVPLVISTLFLAKPIMIFIAGNEFAISSGPLKLLMLATAFIFLGSLTAHTIIALDKQKLMLKFYVIAGVIAVAGYLVFIPIYSYWGAAYMTIVAELLITIPGFFIIWRVTHMAPSLGMVIKSLGASLPMGIMLYIFKGTHVLLLILFSVIVYFVFLYIFKGISSKTIKEFIKP